MKHPCGADGNVDFQTIVFTAGSPVWVITHDPPDYPGKFVLREHVFAAGIHAVEENPAFVGDTLEAVRAAVPRGFRCIPRSPGDLPVIVESWL